MRKLCFRTGERMKKIAIDKNQTAFWLKLLALMVILSFMRSFSAYLFINPNGFAPGGVGGLSALIHLAAVDSPNATVRMLSNSLFDPGIFTIIMNIPLIIAAFCVLDKKFAACTTVCVLLFSGMMYLLSAVGCPQFIANGDYGLMLIAAIAGGACAGVSMGFMLRQDLSIGGTDIIGKIIYSHNPAAHTQWWITACDCCVALISGFLGISKINGSTDATAILTSLLSPVLFSFISLFTQSKVCDMVESGLLSSLVFTIITDKSDAIAHELSVQLHRGVTITKSVGYYTGKEHNVIICVTSKKQVNRVKDIVKACDPQAFMYITQAGEVSGKGFTGGRILKNGEVEKIDMSDIIPSEHLHDNDAVTASDDINVLQTIQTVEPQAEQIATCDTQTENKD